MRTTLPAFLFLFSSWLSAQVPTPEEHLGRPVGADFTLADWDEVSSYFRVLGESSPHVQVQTV